MISILIAIIYLAFISLGLPDSLLGSAWPAMHVDIGAAESLEGVISMTVSVCTIISALLSSRLIKKLGSGRITAFSTVMTACAMLGYSFANSMWQMCLLAIPFGLGAGAIDSCLNNYVALHLSPKHMSWLHCCWGIGALISPRIMGACIAGAGGWHLGYRIVAFIQLGLSVLLFITLPLWRRKSENGTADIEEEAVSLSIGEVFRLKGAVLVFLAFFCYCAIETLPIYWASTYFVNVFKLNKDKAAELASLFYIGMAVSRAGCGFITGKLGDRRMIRLGLAVIAAATLLIIIPSGVLITAEIGFLFIGIGCGPIYPSIVHSTPYNFGKKYSGSVIGVQMAFAYTGFTFSPLIVGLIADAIGIEFLPFGVIILAFFVFVLSETANKVIDKSRNGGNI